jgi:hypothetical protein
VVAGLLALLLPTPSRADVDLNGNWIVSGVIFAFPIVCDLDIVQVGTSISTTGTCDFVGAISLSGTIDPMTGVFSGSGSAAVLCTAPGSLTIAATASDSSNFSGTVDCGGIGGFVVGTRCGNGDLDPGEQCDTGLDVGAFGNCCTATCQYASSSTLCRNAFNCDPAEFCTGSSETCPANVTDPDGTPCNDNDPCATGKTCTAGICTNGTPLPAGTECNPPFECIAFECDGAGTCDIIYHNDPCDDFDLCTTNDACSDGACLGGPPLDCGACQSCDSFEGCLPTIEPVCAAPSGPDSLVLLKEGDSPDDARFKWKWKNGPQIDVEDFGDPRTSTSYSLCMYDQDLSALTGLRLMIEATAAIGDKWTPTAKGYKYKDTSLSSDGLQLIVLKSGAAGKGKITLKGKGAGLDPENLPATLPVVVQLKASNGACWEANYSSVDDNSPIKLQAHGGP